MATKDEALRRLGEAGGASWLAERADTPEGRLLERYAPSRFPSPYGPLGLPRTVGPFVPEPPKTQSTFEKVRSVIDPVKRYGDLKTGQDIVGLYDSYRRSRGAELPTEGSGRRLTKSVGTGTVAYLLNRAYKETLGQTAPFGGPLFQSPLDVVEGMATVKGIGKDARKLGGMARGQVRGYRERSITHPDMRRRTRELNLQLRGLGYDVAREHAVARIKKPIDDRYKWMKEYEPERAAKYERKVNSVRNAVRVATGPGVGAKIARGGVAGLATVAAERALGGLLGGEDNPAVQAFGLTTSVYGARELQGAGAKAVRFAENMEIRRPSAAVPRALQAKVARREAGRATAKLLLRAGGRLVPYAGWALTVNDGLDLLNATTGVDVKGTAADGANAVYESKYGLPGVASVVGGPVAAVGAVAGRALWKHRPSWLFGGGESDAPPPSPEEVRRAWMTPQERFAALQPWGPQTRPNVTRRRPGTGSVAGPPMPPGPLSPGRGVGPIAWPGRSRPGARTAPGGWIGGKLSVPTLIRPTLGPPAPPAKAKRARPAPVKVTVTAPGPFSSQTQITPPAWMKPVPPKPKPRPVRKKRAPVPLQLQNHVQLNLDNRPLYNSILRQNQLRGLAR